MGAIHATGLEPLTPYKAKSRRWCMLFGRSEACTSLDHARPGDILATGLAEGMGEEDRIKKPPIPIYIQIGKAIAFKGENCPG